MGLEEIGGNNLDEVEAAEAVKLPLTSCSKLPRMEEPPSEFCSDLLPLFPSLLPDCGDPEVRLEAVGSGVEEDFKNLGLPTHCWMWGMKMSIGIFSSHLSHINFPVSIISLELTGDLFPATSCLALSSSNNFLTGKDFFLSLEAWFGAIAGCGGCWVLGLAS